MVSHLISSSTLLLVVIVLLIDTSFVSASRDHQIIPRARHHRLANRLPGAVEQPAPPTRLRRRRNSCIKPPATQNNTSVPIPIPKPSPTQPTTVNQVNSTVSPPKDNGGKSGNAGSANHSGWPTVTQAGAVPAATRTSPADPYLRSLSHALDNSANRLFTDVHVGQMTYYGQGLGACGDTYDDKSFTAAVSMLMFDIWPGASAEQNRNPICGPFVPGRKILDSTGSFKSVVGGSEFAIIGGDGLINCDPTSQCHIPLTATVKHGGKQIKVKIVDRCVGCKEGDIDLTPAAFAALADMGLGRTDVEWQFDQY